MKYHIKRPKKLKSPDTITGMWNGVVFYRIFGIETQIRVHIGLSDCERIEDGENPEKILHEIISNELHFKEITIVGVVPNRAVKANPDPFAKPKKIRYTF